MKLDYEIISADANSAIDFFQAGGEHLERGDYTAAIQHYRRAIDLNPEFIEAHYNLGLAYQRLNQFERAALCYRKTLELKPEYFGASNNLGQVLARTGDHSGAKAAFERAHAIDQTSDAPFFNLGELATMRAEWDTAIANYRKAIQINPGMVEAYNNLGNVFQKQENFAAAARCYRQVVSLEPGLAEGHYNLGSTLQLLEEFEDAIRHLKCALSLKPGYKEALNNLALSYKNSGDLQRAVGYFSEALEIDSDFAEAHWNRSFTYLLTGDFTNGWADFEWRFRQPKWATLYPFRLEGPKWDGSTCPDQRILVHDEQGLGDTFQFVRYLPRVKERCGTVILETRRALIPLLEGFPGIDQLVERPGKGHAGTRFDSYIPLLSLPYIFKTTAETIPASVPYLFADMKKSADWQKRLSGGGFKVGIVWAGRPAHMNDKNRSCGLARFSPLADLPGIDWYGLQKGPAASQAGDWPNPGQFHNLGDKFDDFTDTAAVIDNLDLIISVDTSVAHLAGAMGKPVWVLLPYIPDWRWMMHREDSPWYPTMRLFRQMHKGDWGSVFRRMAVALEKMDRHHG